MRCRVAQGSPWDEKGRKDDRFPLGMVAVTATGGPESAEGPFPSTITGTPNRPKNPDIDAAKDENKKTKRRGG